MNPWTLDKHAVGVAVYNYDGDCQSLSFSIGDTFVLQDQHRDWYYGYSIRNQQQQGFFPASYIHILKKEEKSEKRHSQLPCISSINKEITTVLREWGSIWKGLYVKRKKEIFCDVRSRMLELIALRTDILSTVLPSDKKRECKHTSAAKIDEGNYKLGLDMVVRDEDGTIINPKVTSAIKLYELHSNSLKAHDSKSVVQDKQQQIPGPTSNSILVTPTNYVCLMKESTELLLSLYDSQEKCSFTEAYKIHCRGLDSFSQVTALRLRFTDLCDEDISTEKLKSLYLVCIVIRIGGMEDQRRHSQISKRHGSFDVSRSFLGLRRLFGVAVLPLRECHLTGIEEKEHFLPLLRCNEKDEFLESNILKLVNGPKPSDKEHKSQGLYVKVKFMKKDLKQSSHSWIGGNAGFARKIGFPEVVLPGNERNDLYLTLMSGDFSKGNKNIEVSVTVFRNDNTRLENVLSVGSDVPGVSEYCSIVYYHTDKPRWNETILITLPIDDFRSPDSNKSPYIRFTFRHRSANENKECKEPFAMAFIKLIQPDGTTIPDGESSLWVYKIDAKKWGGDGNRFIADNLPYNKGSMMPDGSKPHTTGLSSSNRDTFLIKTQLCSTRLTQNGDLLKVLRGSDNLEEWGNSISCLKKVDGGELVKFLNDILDALFNILHQTVTHDEAVFDSLLHILQSIVVDSRYKQFQAVLDMYIKETFSGSLAFEKLITISTRYIKATRLHEENLVQAIECLPYLIKFIVQSQQLYLKMDPDGDSKEFECLMSELLESLGNVMKLHKFTKAQTMLLDCLPTVIADLLLVYDAENLSYHIKQVLDLVADGQLQKPKMMCIKKIITSELFSYSSCRIIIIPSFINEIRGLLTWKQESINKKNEIMENFKKDKMKRLLGDLNEDFSNSAQAATVNTESSVADEVNEVIELCLNNLSYLLDHLFHQPPTTTFEDIKLLCTFVDILMDLKNVFSTLVYDTKLLPQMTSILLSFLRQMNEDHYIYLVRQHGYVDLDDQPVGLVMCLLFVFRHLINFPVYPSDWSEMLMLQNSVIFKTLKLISITLKESLLNPFQFNVWNEYFGCAIDFLTQPSLQLENFSAPKRQRLLSNYKDMRKDMASEVKRLWNDLGNYAVQFIPSMVGPFLEMTLIPETELRKANIPLFFDMMQREYFSVMPNKGGFPDFENEMMDKLDQLIGNGKGDQHYKKLFQNIISKLSEKHVMKSKGLLFVKTVTKQMERLLEYRAVIQEESMDNKMSCTRSLLDFYCEIKREKMWIRYLYKLYDLHMQCDDFTEAAHTMRLHASRLAWSPEPVPPALQSELYADTQWLLKETLFKIIIDLFDQGKMWEAALELCKELQEQYTEKVYDYEELGDLLNKMSQFYRKIMNEQRFQTEYFRVAFYGKGFPTFLQNKTYIYRGKICERLSDFNTRILNQYPHANLMSTLDEPAVAHRESPEQRIQIYSVEPVLEDRRKLSNKSVCDEIVSYYKCNDVQKFSSSRRVREQGGGDSDFANMRVKRTFMVISDSLPGILRWFPVVSSDTVTITPVRLGIESVENTNKAFEQEINAHNREWTRKLHNLSMKLNGVIDPAVQGGIANYEKSFFTPEYMSAHPEEREDIENLKIAIAKQIPLLQRAMEIHKEKMLPSQEALHKHLEEKFKVMKETVERKYGKMPPYVDTPSRRPSKPKLVNPSIEVMESNRGSNLSLLREAPFFGTLRKNRETKDLRDMNRRYQSQQENSKWYTDALLASGRGPPPIQLSEQLTPKRPPRSEAEREKRNSRTSCDTSRLSIASGLSEGSSSSIDGDSLPPPVPRKNRHSQSDGKYNSEKDANYVELPKKTKCLPPEPTPEDSNYQMPPKKPYRPDSQC